MPSLLTSITSKYMEGYIKCPYCGGETPEQNLTCIYCGNHLPHKLGVFTRLKHGGKGLFFAFVVAALLFTFLAWMLF